MDNSQQQFGKESESIAVAYLKKLGYRILEQNYRTGLGEIDIVARDKKTLVFVEVKARRSFRFGNPKAAVTPRKQRKISMVALSYLKSKGQERSRARFDVVAITAHSGEEDPVVEIIKNAFELCYE
jgi:putative endonuclease